MMMMMVMVGQTQQEAAVQEREIRLRWTEEAFKAEH